MKMVENQIYNSEMTIPAANRHFLHRLRDKIPARLVLYLLSWSGFMVSFIIRSDINLTILAMVKDRKVQAVQNKTEESFCYTIDPNVTESETVLDYGGTLEWSSDAQSYIIASFYWMYVCAHIVGGAVTQRFGTKRVFGFVQLTCALCSFLLPVAAETHFGCVIAIRSVQGFASGFVWPAMYSIVGVWIPTQERSRFLSSFQGSNFGTGISYALCGFLIANFGWPAVFYTSGSIGLIWCLMWYFLVFDSPEKHPRISREEQDYIRKNTDSCYASRKKQKVPWTSMLRSLPMWAISITCFGRVWILYTFTIYGPQYLKHILGFSVEQNGLLSGAPFISCYFSTVLFGYLADQIMNRKLLTKTTTRKLFTFIGQIGAGLLCILMGYIGCNIAVILCLYFLAINLLSAQFSGAMASIVDVAPNFSGVVVGYCQTVYMIAGVFSPLVAGYITRNGHTISAYQTTFNIAAAIGMSTYLMYQFFGTSEIQHWNYRNDEGACKENDVMLQGKKRAVRIVSKKDGVGEEV
ncbi:hypothetical protein PPYR_02965 [Photinus pyralis]|uniref:Major facilitator superfamily (MFS) profile domain-containing protein n=2 Tax=Photinus pyralis TaxID=7054 RepID=A0A5N4A1G6_PHOPY|nr:sialin-like [Photinus pyralis]XP_031331479.1 sialin-like [Photinus pyralis]KAB0791165.1 hypothetical protein PPYR_02965 [Photinus pyralis]